nr:hypothetical protein CFP56_72091 [Quercus suber]
MCDDVQQSARRSFHQCCMSPAELLVWLTNLSEPPDFTSVCSVTAHGLPLEISHPCELACVRLVRLTDRSAEIQASFPESV